MANTSKQSAKYTRLPSVREKVLTSQKQGPEAERRSRISRAVVITVCAVILLLVAVTYQYSDMDATGELHLEYHSVPGYFHQDDPDTNWETFDWTQRLGLFSHSWHTFAKEVDALNAAASSATNPTVYKVLILGRHGQGYHNVAEAYYGSTAWDCYYSMLPGNATMSWTDARLTPTGEQQAGVASKAWADIMVDGFPGPESWYSSPLTRCLQTAYSTFGPLLQDVKNKQTESSYSAASSSPASRSQQAPFEVKIREMLRETIGVHTCDKRSKKSEIQALWSSESAQAYGTMPLSFEPGFAEDDGLWDLELRETEVGEDRRSRIALDEIFINDPKTFISISAHSGVISSLLRVLNHRRFGLTTGAVIPILVKAEKVKGSRPAIPGEAWERVTRCAEPPAAKTGVVASHNKI